MSLDRRPDADLRRLAFTKMKNVLGDERARQLMDSLLRELGVELRTPDELLRFGERMSAMGGFESAVGAMLSVAAVLRGATPAD